MNNLHEWLNKSHNRHETNGEWLITTLLIGFAAVCPFLLWIWPM